VRIGLVTEEYHPSHGALGAHVQGFAREARRLGHVVRIVSGAAPAQAEESREDLVRVGFSSTVLRAGRVSRATRGGGLGAALREALARERFDVLHVHAPLTPVLPLLAVHHASGAVVGSFHDTTRPGLLARLARKTLQRHVDRLDAAIAVSRAAADAFSAGLQTDLRLIPGGVDFERFARAHRLRRFQDGKLNVLWVGRPEPRNGLDTLIAAFARARRQLDARLLVVGGGPRLPHYRARVPRELEEDVVFAGELDEALPDWYASADVFCAPAQGPSSGATLLEAMAAGKPVLASDVAGYRDVVQHGREGELVAPDDPAAWARALLRMAREPQRAAAYADRGRLTAQRRAWPGVAREILGVYRAIGVRG
jgi:phosphatidylinositol alpha-mannosyltransferase